MQPSEFHQYDSLRPHTSDEIQAFVPWITLKERRFNFFALYFMPEIFLLIFLTLVAYFPLSQIFDFLNSANSTQIILWVVCLAISLGAMAAYYVFTGNALLRPFNSLRPSLLTKVVNFLLILCVWGVCTIPYWHTYVIQVGQSLLGSFLLYYWLRGGIAYAVNRADRRALGIYEPSEEPPSKVAEERRERLDPDEPFGVHLLGWTVPALRTPDGIRAMEKDFRVASSASVERYLASKFGDRLEEVRAAMEQLAASLSPEELNRHGFARYEAFRPDIPAGARGWGATGELDLERIISLTHCEP